ncbi:MAG: hypothetical protein KDE56_18655 [Anaerolineales bacterium]|nr:hypothetical protein [Anaerolineales bacterium]
MNKYLETYTFPSAMWFRVLLFLSTTILICAGCQANTSVTPTPTKLAKTDVPSIVKAVTTRVTVTPFLSQPITPSLEPTVTPPIIFLPSISSTATPLPVTNEVAFEVVNQQWGTTNSVGVVKTTVYLGAGARLLALDFTDPTRLVPVWQSDVLPGIVNAVLVKDNILYLGAGTSVLTFDISTPRTPKLLAEFSLSGSIDHLILDGNLLVATIRFSPSGTNENGFGMLTMIDALHPNNLQLLDSLVLPWPAHGVALANGTVYVSHPTDDTFYAISLREPPNLPPAIPMPGVPLIYSLQAAGSTLYLGGSLSNIMAWNVNDPSKPVPLWEKQAKPNSKSGLGVVQGFELSKEKIFIASAGLHGQKMEPVVLENSALDIAFPDEYLSSKLVVQGDYLFLADDGLVLYDVADPAEPVLISRYTQPIVWDVGLVGETGLFIEGNGDQLDKQTGHLYAVALPNLVSVGKYSDEQRCQACFASFLKLFVKDDRAYVTVVEDGLRIFDVHTPDNLQLFGSLDASNGFANLRAGDVAVADGFAFVAMSGECNGRNLTIVDIHDLNRPRQVNTLSIDGCIEQIAIDKNMIYVAAHYADRLGGAVYLFSNQASELQPKGIISFLDPVLGVQVLENSIAAVTTAGIQIITTVDLDNPTVVANLLIPNGITDFAVMDQLIFLTTAVGNGSGQLYAVSISKPEALYAAGLTQLPDAGGYLAVGDDYVLVGNPIMGLILLHLKY